MTVSHQPSGPSLAARLQCKHRADDDENEQQVDLSEDQFPRVVLAKAHDQQGEQHAHGLRDPQAVDSALRREDSSTPSIAATRSFDPDPHREMDWIA